MNYLKIAALFAIAAVLNALAPWLLQRIVQLGGIETAIASTLWCLSLFLGFGWACSKVAEGTVFPSFTIQLLIGIVLHDALSPLSVQLRWRWWFAPHWRRSSSSPGATKSTAKPL